MPASLAKSSPGPDPVDAVRRSLERSLGSAAGINLDAFGPLPSCPAWTLAPDALRLLASLVEQLRPRHILEFGAGLSTRVLSRACREHRPDGRITSIDHDPEFGQAAYCELVAEHFDDRVLFQIAPLVARDCAGRPLPLYHLQPERFALQAPPDLIVIDGPPTMLGGREGMLYQALDYARRGTLVLLDDADRPEEQAALSRWQENLGDAIEVLALPGFVKGMAAILVHDPVRRADLWSHRLRLTARQIEALIPAGSTYVLVDDDLWDRPLVPGRREVPLLGPEGEYRGPPPDDAAALRELDRRRQSGAQWVVFGWPSFWWLDHYPGLHDHLRSAARCLVRNERLVLFDLQP